MDLAKELRKIFDSALNTASSTAQNVLDSTDVDDRIMRGAGQVSDRVQRGAKIATQQAKDTAHSGVNYFSSKGNEGNNFWNSGAARYFDPKSNKGDNFWQSPVVEGMANFQRTAEQGNLPKINLSQYTEGIEAPVPRFGAQVGAGIADELLSLPQRLVEGTARVSQDIRTINEGGEVTPRRAIGSTASIVEPFFDVATMGGAGIAKGIGKQAIKQGAEQTGRQALKRGAKTGAGYGGAFGLLRGLSEGEEAELGNAVEGLLMGTALGGVFGGGTAGVGNFLGKLTTSIKKAKPDATDREVSKMATTWIKDATTGKLQGRAPKDQVFTPAGGTNRLKDQPIKVRDWRDQVTREMGLDDLNTQGGFVRLGGETREQAGKSKIQEAPLLSSPEQPLALPGRYAARTPTEAKRLFKKTGKAPELGFNLKSRKTPIKMPGQSSFYSAQASAQTPQKVRVKTQQAREQTAKQDFEEWQRQLFRQAGGTRTTTGAVNDLERAIKQLTRSGAARNIDELKDISSPATKFKDIFRNFKTVYGDKYNEVKKTVLDPLFVKGKRDLINDQEKWINRISKDVEQGFGIKKGTKESADVQKFGEGLLSYDDLVKKYGQKKADTITQADKWFRKHYDQLLDEVNEVRARIYPNNPEKIIPKRQDYYRHFEELSQGIDGLLNTLGRSVDVSPELAGISFKTKPKSKWLSFAQQRLGNKTEYDAVGGFIDYVKAQTYAKNIDPHIDTFRQLGRELAEEGSEQGKGLNNFTLFLEQFADDLSGKTNPADRYLQETIGRKPMAVANWLNQRVKANVILGNASSALAQPFNLPNGIADAGPRFATKGISKALASMFAPNKPANKSTFLKERYFRGFEKFDRGVVNDSRKFAAWMITSLDEVSTKAMWNMQYEKAVAQGVKNPVNYADDATRSLVAGRGIGEMPLIQRSKLFQLIAPFQVEVTNAWHVIGDMVSEKQFGKLATLAVSSYVMNRAVEQVRGSDVSFDPINATVEGVEALMEEENKGIGALRLGGRVGGEIFSNLPVGQTAGALYPEYGFQIGDTEFPTREEFFGEGDPTRFGGTGLPGVLGGGIQDPLFKVLPPHSGQQIKRSLEGIQTSLRGYSETPKGNVRFPVEGGALNNIQRGIFGQYSTPEAREYFDEDRRPLGENQTELFKNLTGDDQSAYYENLMGTRSKNKEIKEIKEQLKEQGSGQVAAGDTFVYLDPDSGDAKTIDISRFREEPEGTSAKYKWRKDKWETAREAYNSPLENKNDIIEALEIDPQDVAYYDLAKQEVDLRSLIIREELDSIMAGNRDRGAMLQRLAEMRREVQGEMVLTSGVISDLEDEGYISDFEAKQLRKTKIGEDGQVKVKTSGRGKSAKIKNIKLTALDEFGKSSNRDLNQLLATRQTPQIQTPQLQTPSLGNVNVPQAPKFRVKFNL